METLWMRTPSRRHPAVHQTTIRGLASPLPIAAASPSGWTLREEFEVYEVIGGITLVRFEHDGDYHIALADPPDTSYTIVTEVAAHPCQGAIRSPHRGALESARNSRWPSSEAVRRPAPWG